MSFVVILLLSIVTITIVLISYYYIYPQRDFTDVNEIPKSYIIESFNRIDIQNNNECAAFSSAYVLRHFGIEADGNELYNTYTYKLPDGTISPKGIIACFKNYGYTAFFSKGSIDILKKRITNGVPAIVLVKVFPNKRFLHYVPIVGYDEEYFYLADSLKFKINSNEINYNRKISIRDFETIWKTWIPFYNNTYVYINNCD